MFDRRVSGEEGNLITACQLARKKKRIIETPFSASVNAMPCATVSELSLVLTSPHQPQFGTVFFLARQSHVTSLFTTRQFVYVNIVCLRRYCITSISILPACVSRRPERRSLTDMSTSG